MSKSRKAACPQCRVLSARLAKLEAELARLREELAAAKKTSATSSKPPSSDIVKPQAGPAAGAGDEPKRKIGGQPGHALNWREPFPLEEIQHFHTHALDVCPDCGGRLRRNASFAKVVEQVDMELPTLTVQQHTCPEYWCATCRKSCWAPLPLQIQRGGLLGPNLTALIAFLKGACHASFSTIRKFLRDVVGVTVGRSTLAKTVKKVSAALEGSYAELLVLLPFEDVLNIDETGHKDNGKLWWTWCLRADLYTIYKIDARRSAEVLLETLGAEFNGVIGCDYFSAYRRYLRVMSIEMQFCLAHLIRDVKFLTTLPDARDRAYGEQLRQALHDLFGVIHRRDQLSASEFAAELQTARALVLHYGQHAAPPTRHGQNMAKRFREHGEAYFTFVTTPGVDPTNNRAEQAIRFVVIDRHITQGTRGAAGRQWCERIWTVVATCAQQGRSLYAFIKEAIHHWYNGAAAPSLLPEVAPM